MTHSASLSVTNFCFVLRALGGARKLIVREQQVVQTGSALIAGAERAVLNRAGFTSVSLSRREPTVVLLANDALIGFGVEVVSSDAGDAHRRTVLFAGSAGLVAGFTEEIVLILTFRAEFNALLAVELYDVLFSVHNIAPVAHALAITVVTISIAL